MSENRQLTLSIGEASAQLGISKALGYKLAKAGQFPGAIRLGAKRILVSRAQLERFLEGKDREGAESCQ